MWDPSLYARFAVPRLRPALDLLAHVPLDTAETVIDLGCGAGAAFPALRARFPDARLIGVDSAREMLATATGADELVHADAAMWRPSHPVDVLFSNATLHWVSDHATLLPALLEAVRPGGAMAVQMPRNHARPSHSLIADVAREGPWRALLEPILVTREAPVEEPEYYYDLLGPLAARIDLWEVDYLHVLRGDNPVADWTRSTALRPFLEALDADQQEAFWCEYSARVEVAYPAQADGSTLFPFRRLFFVAVR